tara:strand:+ start:1263 stop:1850 length:588 start_codon:yes stop_codon:yes gene_type:complete
MLFNVEEDLKLCQELKLTARQLMFVKILYRDPKLDAKEWRLKSYEMSLRFQDLSPLTEDELTDMVERDIIIDLNTSGGKVYYDCFEINPKYKKKFSMNIVSWVSELFDVYPKFFYMEGRRFNAITASEDDIAEYYLKAIGKRRETHEEVISLTKAAAEDSMITMGIEKFIKTKHWLSLRVLKQESKRITNDSKLG